MYIVCYTGACVHERHRIITINRIHFTLVIALFALIYVHYGLIMGDLIIFFKFLFLFSYKIRYGKGPFPLEWWLSLASSAVAASGIWRMGEAQKWLSLSLSPSPVISTWSSCPWSRPRGPGRCGRTAASLPKQLSCIFKRQLQTHHNKNASTSKGCELDVFMPCDATFFCCAQVSCDSLVNACISPLSPAQDCLPKRFVLPQHFVWLGCFEK